MLIGGAGCSECFEVTALLPQRSAPAPIALSTMDDYLFADFTINLSLETQQTDALCLGEC